MSEMLLVINTFQTQWNINYWQKYREIIIAKLEIITPIYAYELTTMNITCENLRIDTSYAVLY